MSASALKHTYALAVASTTGVHMSEDKKPGRLSDHAWPQRYQLNVNLSRSVGGRGVGVRVLGIELEV